MAPDKRQTASEEDPKAGLSPWAIGAALGTAAAVWLFLELILRGG